MYAMYGKGMAGLDMVAFLSLPIANIPPRPAFFLGFLSMTSQRDAFMIGPTCKLCVGFNACSAMTIHSVSRTQTTHLPY